MPRNTKETAADTYAERRRDIDWLLETLRAELVEHAGLATDRPADWSLAGDIGHVRNELIELVAFLTEQEPAEVARRLDEVR